MRSELEKEGEWECYQNSQSSATYNNGGVRVLMVGGIGQDIVSLPEVDDCISDEFHTDFTLWEKASFPQVRKSTSMGAYGGWEIQEVPELIPKLESCTQDRERRDPEVISVLLVNPRGGWQMVVFIILSPHHNNSNCPSFHGSYCLCTKHVTGHLVTHSPYTWNTVVVCDTSWLLLIDSTNGKLVLVKCTTLPYSGDYNPPLSRQIHNLSEQQFQQCSCQYCRTLWSNMKF